MTTNLDMQSPEIGSLLEALAKAQAKMEGASKDSANPFFKSKYADLASIWEACRDPLTSNGLSVIQNVLTIDGQMYLVSILGHASGQWIKSFLPIITAKSDIQSLGSAITYCRRYSLAALVGVCPEDDDGESAMDRNKKPEKKERPSVELNLPQGVDRVLVEEFVKISCAGKSYTPEDLKHKASSNMEEFLKVFNAWKDKNAS